MRVGLRAKGEGTGWKGITTIQQWKSWEERAVNIASLIPEALRYVRASPLFVWKGKRWSSLLC